MDIDEQGEREIIGNIIRRESKDSEKHWKQPVCMNGYRSEPSANPSPPPPLESFQYRILQCMSPTVQAYNGPPSHLGPSLSLSFSPEINSLPALG